MASSPAHQPVAAAALSLLVFVASVAAFLPPWVARTTASVPLVIVLGISIGVSFLLHIAFVAIAARRVGRSGWLWGALALVLFPVGSIAGLILFEWFSHENGTAEALQKGAG